MKDFLDSPEWEETSKAFNDGINAFQKEADDLWQALPYDDKLKLFCAMSKLIYEGEIKQRGTYRYVLYDVFDFGPDAYVPAQCAGYLAIHNAIFDGEEVANTIKEFVETGLDITKDNLQEQINAFILKKHL
jgi:hypothetical protein